jgi:DNA-binding response OmpR family regulator
VCTVIIVIRIIREGATRVLIVEDERKMVDTLQRGLAGEGYAVDTAGDGEEGQEMAENTPYDLIILDVMLPKKEGTEVCRDLRNKRITAPILMLTCKDELNDRVKGLDAGADDYLTKPFEFPELYARMRALLRRGKGSASPVLRAGGITLDPRTKTVQRNDEKIALTRTEYEILYYLMVNQGLINSKNAIGSHVWQTTPDIGANLVEVHVGRLRIKIGDQREDGLIQTVRGFGYRIL